MSKSQDRPKSKPGRKSKAGSDSFVPDFFAATPGPVETPKPTSQQPQDHNPDNIYIYNNIGLGDNKESNVSRLGQNQEDKSPFDAKERIFLENLLLKKMDMRNSYKNALISMGCNDMPSDAMLSYYARKIVIRYEAWAGEARKVFRQAGVGEVRLARTVDKLMDSPSDRTKLGACELTAKVLRASQEPEAGSQGVRININIMQGGPAASGPGAPALVQVDEIRPGIPTPTRPLQITK